jgi:hypothetical protein
MKDFVQWKAKLETVWDLKTEEDDKVFYELMDALKGSEDIRYFDALIEAVRLKEDNGIYESLWNAMWTFPPALVGKLLAKHLPEFQKRMGKYDQVSRFYIPIEKPGAAQKAFLEETKSWSSPDKRMAIKAIQSWAIESEAWEPILEQLGAAVKTSDEDPIPHTWPEPWKTRLLKARQGKGEFTISEILWKGGKKQWLEDLDFVIELLALNHGANWRQIDTMTNPLWGYAKTTIYPEFLKRSALLPKQKLDKILNNVKKVNKSKYKILLTDLGS